MMERNIGISFVFDLLLGELYLSDEEVHDLDGFLLDAGLDAVSFGKVIEGLEHVDSLLNSCDLLEGKINDVLIHDIQLFHSSLEGIVLLVPV